MARIQSNKRNKNKELDGYDSDLERAVAAANGGVAHNKLKVPYVLPPRTYNPDFVLPVGEGKILMIEVKGHLTEDDRQKYRAVRDSYHMVAQALNTKSVELVFVFKDGDARVNPRKKGSITYLDWCKREGFRATDTPYFPDEWFEID